MPNPPVDTLGRPLRSLRISVTDRCNLRCHYCMPEAEYVWLPKKSLLTYEEMDRLASAFARVGVDKIRLTGGEPLLRHDLPVLVEMLAAGSRFRDIALTTNGVLLARTAADLKQAGLSRLTLSLDTLRADRFAAYARRNRLDDVLAGIEAAGNAGFVSSKLNAVLTKGDNDDEILPLFDFASARNLEVRYIEYMDVGGATRWSMEDVVTRQDILAVFHSAFGSVAPVDRAPDPSAPAERFEIPDGRRFGIVASTTAPFCRSCDRGRLTADGTFFRCLYADDGLDLRTPLRSGASDDELTGLIAESWRTRADRGAEERAERPGRQALYQIGGLREDPHREMHTRGG